MPKGDGPRLPYGNTAHKNGGIRACKLALEQASELAVPRGLFAVGDTQGGGLECARRGLEAE